MKPNSVIERAATMACLAPLVCGCADGAGDSKSPMDGGPSDVSDASMISDATTTGEGHADDARVPADAGPAVSDGGGPSCGTNEHESDGRCVCDPGYVREGEECVPEEPSCDGETPPRFSEGGGVYERRVDGTNGEELDSFDPFPGTKGTKENIQIPSNRYLSIPFTAPEAGRSGALFFISDTSLTGGSLLVTASRCAGDFRSTLGDRCRIDGIGAGNFYWDTAGNDFSCSLEPGEHYFLNMAFASGESNDLTDNCWLDGMSCGRLMQWDNSP